MLPWRPASRCRGGRRCRRSCRWRGCDRRRRPPGRERWVPVAGSRDPCGSGCGRSLPPSRRRKAGDHPAELVVVHQLGGDAGDLVEPLEAEMGRVAAICSTLSAEVEDRLAAGDMLEAEVVDHRHAGGMRVAERAWGRLRRASGAGDLRWDRRVGAREEGPSISRAPGTPASPSGRRRFLAAGRSRWPRPTPVPPVAGSPAVEAGGGADRRPEAESGHGSARGRLAAAALGPAFSSQAMAIWPSVLAASVAEGRGVGRPSPQPTQFITMEDRARH